MRHKLISSFVCSAGALLSGMAVVLFIVNWASGDLVSARDPIVLISTRAVFCILGALALAVALICLLGQDPLHQLMFVAWLATMGLCYRIGLSWYGVRFSGCLGSFPQTFDISTDFAVVLVQTVFAYLLVGSYAALLLMLSGRRNRMTSTGEDEVFKTACAHCGGHIAFPMGRRGEEIACPHCGKATTLQATAS